MNNFEKYATAKALASILGPGAVVGGATGALATDDKKDKLRNAILGALLGSTTGAMAGGLGAARGAGKGYGAAASMAATGNKLRPESVAAIMSTFAGQGLGFGQAAGGALGGGLVAATSNRKPDVDNK
jgi:hypothetical protein